LTGELDGFDSWSFDPVSWKPNYPNPAFVLMDREDAFWAAKQAAAFTDAEIRALVETGEYTDPRATEWIVDSLIKRRDKIAEAWLSRLPLDKFTVADGKLTFDDLGAGRDAGKPRGYTVHWASQDSDGALTALPGTAGRDLPATRTDTQYLLATIKASEADANSITVYLCQRHNGFEVIEWIQRMNQRDETAGLLSRFSTTLADVERSLRAIDEGCYGNCMRWDPRLQ
jgi:hypothetical protein